MTDRISFAELSEAAVDAAAAVIEQASAVLVTAGAGMGVDSGLPDFRGDEGFWRAYPPLHALGLSFMQMANPRWFRDDPALAWGFYGHRLALYRRTTPHDGFRVLARIAETKPYGGFVFTSNVDGAFQRAGFSDRRIVECHGAIERAQCFADCGVGIFDAPEAPDVDETTFRASAPLPTCPACGGMARPNILLFGDIWWDASDHVAQDYRMRVWLSKVLESGGRLAVVELGAGTAIPTVRELGEDLIGQVDARLVRINVREPEVPPGHVGIAAGAKATLQAIEARLFPAGAR